MIIAVNFQFKQLERRSLKTLELQRDSNRDLRDTGAMLYQLSYEATHWERDQFIGLISSLAPIICGLIKKNNLFPRQIESFQLNSKNAFLYRCANIV